MNNAQPGASIQFEGEVIEVVERDGLRTARILIQPAVFDLCLQEGQDPHLGDMVQIRGRFAPEAGNGLYLGPEWDGARLGAEK